MPSEFIEADKTKIASSLSKIIEEDRDKYHVYHDIYHVLKTSCSCVVPSDEVLPEREDLLRFAQKKMHVGLLPSMLEMELRQQLSK
jgi:hypothetical protein